MVSKSIISFALLAVLLASADAYRIVDIQNDLSEILDPNNIKSEDLYFMSDEKDEKFEQKLSEAEEKLKKIEDKLRKLQESEEVLKKQLKKSQDEAEKNRMDKTQFQKVEVEEKNLESGFWNIAINIGKSLLNKLLNYFGINLFGVFK